MHTLHAFSQKSSLNALLHPLQPSSLLTASIDFCVHKGGLILPHPSMLTLLPLLTVFLCLIKFSFSNVCRAAINSS